MRPKYGVKLTRMAAMGNSSGELHDLCINHAAKFDQTVGMQSTEIAAHIK
jgi:hypothetical protein